MASHHAGLARPGQAVAQPRGSVPVARSDLVPEAATHELPGPFSENLPEGETPSVEALLRLPSEQMLLDEVRVKRQRIKLPKWQCEVQAMFYLLPSIKLMAMEVLADQGQVEHDIWLYDLVASLNLPSSSGEFFAPGFFETRQRFKEAAIWKIWPPLGFTHDEASNAMAEMEDFALDVCRFEALSVESIPAGSLVASANEGAASSSPSVEGSGERSLVASANEGAASSSPSVEGSGERLLPL
jgi:hypothetical protein